MPDFPKIVIVSGPTASGKSDWVHRLADPVSDQVINIDSRLFYRHLNIGTAKPSPEEILRYRYRLIDFLEPGAPFSAYDFLTHFLAQLDEIQAAAPKPQMPQRIFVVGGSLFYCDVIKNGLPQFPPLSPEIKTRLQRSLEKRGLPYLTQILKAKDPEYYRTIDLNNPRRVLRALEILESGATPSDLRKNRVPPPVNFLELIPIFPREILYRRIEERIDAMISQGWIEEVRDLLTRFSPDQILNCHAIGYSQIIEYIRGKIGYPECLDLIKQKTRQLAKSQITWIKKDTSGILIYSHASGYNYEALDNKKEKFINSVDTWLNGYPWLKNIQELDQNDLILPVLLMSDNPYSDIDLLLRRFYE